ncbi:MAG TPA: DUF58 domain-containing protein [Planctomycetota bacterium]|nr:DUF58 domain-containing protein [Planctomycetota bacterium]
MAQEHAQPSPFSLVDGSIVDRIRQLELFSRFRVESFLAGPNKSPFKGFSSDFVQHRQYFHGDSLRFLDWRLYGRTEKLHVRQYEDLTNARVSVVLDVSNSMAYRAPDATFSKHDFAVRCAALIFYLALLHKDSFSLALFNTRVVERTPFGSGRTHLHRVLRGLVGRAPEGPTDFTAGLNEAASFIRRKGVTVVLSDFMDDPERIVRVISHLRYEGSDVIAMQIFDPAEREMDFSSITRFHDLESEEVIALDPVLLRREYRREFDLHQAEMKDACRRHGFDHVALPVCTDYDVPLLEYVRRRMELFS